MKLRIFALLALVGACSSAWAWDWKLLRDASGMTGEAVSSADYAIDQWTSAPVPGTVALAYTRSGLIEDIRYDDNLTRIDGAFKRTHFDITPYV